MHKIILALTDAAIIIPQAKKLFATYSKTREEREIAGHASWVKRSVASIDTDLAGQVDIEYSTGTVWLGDSMIASATRPMVPGSDKDSMILPEEDDKRGWIDLKALAKETKNSQPRLKQALDECCR